MNRDKLSKEKAARIRHRYATEPAVSMQSLAVGYGVTAATICALLKNHTWHDPTYTPQMRGEGNRSQLTWETVREIRERYKGKDVTTRSLGAEYGITAVTVSKIIRNLFWVDESYTPPDTPDRTPRTPRKRAVKLSWEAVYRIRQQYTEGGHTTRSLAAEYGVSAVTISKIIRNLFWTDDRYTPPTR